MQPAPQPSPLTRTVGMPADAMTVRALMQDLALDGWAALPGHEHLTPRVVVRESGAGAAEVHVEVDVADDDQDEVAAAVDESLQALREHVMRRTSDAG
jgi:deferrochelatase/peroxidase EfeB